MEIDFFLFRHGQTDWNLQKKCQGSTDIPLNQTGIDQANELATFMKRYPLDAIFTSHLKRAHRTAQIISEIHNIPLFIEKDLRETFFGEMEGMFVNDIIAHVGEKFWHQFRDMHNNDPNIALPGGENRGSVSTRMERVLKTVVEEGKYSCVGISTHGSALVNVLRLYWEDSREFPHIGNCALFHLKYDPDEGFKPIGFLYNN